MPVVCRKIGYGRCFRAATDVRATSSATVESKSRIVPCQSIYASSHETIRPTAIRVRSQANAGFSQVTDLLATIMFVA